jgi:ATP-binding cassette, subfamily B, bacterial
MPENTAQSASSAQPKRKFNLSNKLKIVDLLRPHWTALTLAFTAVLGETLTDVLEPWPVKIVVDNLLQHKRLPNWIGRPVVALFGDNQIAILNFALGAVAAIAIVGALS